MNERLLAKPYKRFYHKLYVQKRLAYRTQSVVMLSRLLKVHDAKNTTLANIAAGRE